MCTAISYKTKTHYFGRNLDMDCSFGEDIVIMPRNFLFKFRCDKTVEAPLALIGTALVKEGVPLFYAFKNFYYNACNASYAASCVSDNENVGSDI